MSGRVVVLRGDAAHLPLPDASIDAVVCDPPYGLEFMGKEWDTFKPAKGKWGDREHKPTITDADDTPHHRAAVRQPSVLKRCAVCGGNSSGQWNRCGCEVPQFQAPSWPMSAFQRWCEAWARECLRVLKPGGYLLAFGGTRTWHRLVCGIEDAGFEIRDSTADLTGRDAAGLIWMYGSGFPKSHSVHKATLSAVELRYGDARCNCLDVRDGHPDRDGIRREGGSEARVARGSGQVQAAQAGASDLQVIPGSDLGPVRELRADDPAQAAGSPPGAEAVLLAGLRGCGSEAAGLGDPALRAGLEEPQGRDPAAGQDMPVVREDAGTEQGRASRSPSAAVPVRGDEPPGEPSRIVRSMPPLDRGDDGSGAGVDPGRCESRQLVLDGDGGGRGALVRVCSWCGLPDPGWLDSLIPLGTALKPGWEPIAVARKPLAGTVAANVLKYGTGALNVAACQVDTEARVNNAGGASSLQRVSRVEQGYRPTVTGSRNEASEVAGRWPPNVVFTHAPECVPAGTRKVRNRSGGISPTVPSGPVDAVYRDRERVGWQAHGDADGMETVESTEGCMPGCPVAELDAQSGVSKSSGGDGRGYGPGRKGIYGDFGQQKTLQANAGGLGDTGGASRYFPVFRYEAKADAASRPRLPDGTAWPTVKPVPLIRWLLRLVTPPGGTILDPFCGTGPTGEAAIIEGFNAILLDKDPQAIALTRVRLAKPIQPLMFGLDPDPGERARALGVPKPPPVPEDQGSLFDLEAS